MIIGMIDTPTHRRLKNIPASELRHSHQPVVTVTVTRPFGKRPANTRLADVLAIALMSDLNAQTLSGVLGITGHLAMRI